MMTIYLLPDVTPALLSRDIEGWEQAAAWLLEFLEGRFQPDYSQWKDITEERMERWENFSAML